MINKCIFLDVDGVLNTSLSRFDGEQMAHSKLKNLGSVLLATGAKIVVSSSWRFGGIGHSSEFAKTMKKACKDAGDYVTAQLILSRIVGTTEIPQLSDDKIQSYPTREQEILNSVKEREISKWVAVDDEGSFFPSNPSWLVLCSPHVGLDERKAAEILSKLQ